MHPLLIQQTAIDEIVKLVNAQGFKPLNEARFDMRLLTTVLVRHGLTNEEVDKWVAYLHIEGYIKLTADDHHRNPTYITLTPKGMAAETAKYFKETYKQLDRDNWKFWTQIISEIILGAIAIIAFVITTNQSCNKQPIKPSTTQPAAVNNIQF